MIVFWPFLYLFYKILVEGREKILQSRFLIANNSGVVGLILIHLLSKGKIRFVVEGDYYDSIRPKFLLRLFGLRLIGFSKSDVSTATINNLTRISRWIEKGSYICFFGGAGIVPCQDINKIIGMLDNMGNSYKRELTPVFIGGTGKERSYYNKCSAFRTTKRILISVQIGNTVKFDSSDFVKNQTFSLLMTNHYLWLNKYRRPLYEYFYKSVRKNAKSQCVSDQTGKLLSYKETLIGSIVLAGKLKRNFDKDKCVGVMLAPCAAGVLSNLAASMLDKIVVNLNYSMGYEFWNYCAEKVDLRMIITSKVFLKKLSIDCDDSRFVFIEDLISKITKFEKVVAWLKYIALTKINWLYKRKFDPKKTATIIFSSGSSGKPKGIELSHANIISNIEQSEKIFRIDNTDKILGVLPFFHSFGFTASLWLPLICRASSHYMVNPLDAISIGNAISKVKATVLLATPTFLLTYIRRIDSDNLRSVGRVFVGAEKLKKQTYEDFLNKFGVSVQEGYGMTELSPVVSVNLDGDAKIGGGNRVGTAGFIVPGTSIKIIDLNSGLECDVNQSGKVLIKGPSVMKGYFDNGKENANAFVDGWYDTGDIGYLDNCRYLTIVDRLARFSKIGGEMVSHVNIEHSILELLDINEQDIVVTSVSDDSKGEQIAVLYLKDKIKLDQLHKAIIESDIPNISKPKKSNLIGVQNIPYLGSGKLDLVSIKNMAKNNLNT